MDVVIKILAIGIFATVIMDIWATFSNRVLNFPRTNWAMVGRWLGHIPSGKYIHNPVGRSAEIKYESILGWVFHYFVGVIYASFYVAMVLWQGEGSSSLLNAWLFGLLTILSPWFILQPALGLGICAAKAPKPNMVRLQNFAIHSIFGIALYYGWLSINT
ncbi:MAG: DUF2938 domain-containing protein [Colwellia sp.]|nr:DUF2938 domain-containing protein [Colwellia sp.]